MVLKAGFKKEREKHGLEFSKQRRKEHGKKGTEGL